MPEQTPSATLSNSALPRTSHAWFVLPVMALAFCVYGIMVIGRDYPSGPDYGLHLYYADQMLEAGGQVVGMPHFQLGIADWAALPGGPLMYTALSALSGRDIFENLGITLIYAIINVGGVYLLSWRIFRRLDAAFVAAVVAALTPAYFDVMSWAGYPNLIAISILPVALVVWLDYWEKPTIRTGLLAVIVITGLVYVHHVTSLWLGLTLVLFGVVEFIRHPVYTLRRAVPLGIIGVVVGIPILLQALSLFIGNDATEVLTQPGRFDGTRITWEVWTDIATPLAITVFVAGLGGLAFNRRIQPSARILILAFAGVCLLFSFGWIIGLRFYYQRALFFYGLPLAIGSAAFVTAWSMRYARALLATGIALALGINAIVWGHDRANHFQVLTPRTVDAAQWLTGFAQPDEITLVGTLFGFHMPRLMERPLIVGMPADLIGNVAELDIAADGVAVLKGLHNMDAVLADRNIRYIMVRNINDDTYDIPDPIRTRRIMDAHPNIRLLYRNADVLIYEVQDE